MPGHSWNDLSVDDKLDALHSSLTTLIAIVNRNVDASNREFATIQNRLTAAERDLKTVLEGQPSASSDGGA
jgi:hypothetical protein